MTLFCFGNPLDIDEPARFAKPDFFVWGLRDVADFGVYEWRLFDHLTAIVIDVLARHGLEGAASGFVVRARPLRRAMGETARRSNLRLREGLDALQRAGIVIPHEGRDGVVREARFPLLSFRALDLDSPVVEFDLDPRLKKAVLEARAFGLVDLGIVRSLSSKWSFPILSILCLRRKMNRPEIALSMEEVGRVTGAVRQLDNAALLRRDVVAPALRDLARAGVTADCRIEGRGSQRRLVIGPALIDDASTRRPRTKKAAGGGF